MSENKEDIKKAVGLMAKTFVEFYEEEINDSIDSGEITIDEIGTIFTECLRFALS